MHRLFLCLVCSLSICAACSEAAMEEAPSAASPAVDMPAQDPSADDPMPMPPMPAAGPQSQFDVPYRMAQTAQGDITLALDVYQSGAVCEAPRPAVLLIHGGGFRGGSKGNNPWPFIAAGLVDEGYVAISINYRLERDDPVLSDDFQPFVDTLIQLAGGAVSASELSIAEAAIGAIEDGTAALEWTRENANALCIDPQRVGLWGGSAGAFVALGIGYGLDDQQINIEKPQVVIDYWGQLLRFGNIAADDPPLFVLHGDEDTTVDYQAALDLEAGAQAAGVQFSFYTIEGAGHGFGAIPIDNPLPDGRTLEEITVAFLNAHLLEGDAVYEKRTFALVDLAN